MHTNDIKFKLVAHCILFLFGGGRPPLTNAPRQLQTIPGVGCLGLPLGDPTATLMDDLCYLVHPAFGSISSTSTVIVVAIMHPSGGRRVKNQ